MDKWDESVERIKNSILAEEPDAALAGALGLLADFGRVLEQQSADLDRIATALEYIAEETPSLDEPEPQVHDL